MVSALQQPWSQMLMHDQFPALRQQLLADEHQGDGHKGKEDQMQQAMVALMQKCSNEVPGYHLSVLVAMLIGCIAGWLSQAATLRDCYVPTI